MSDKEFHCKKCCRDIPEEYLDIYNGYCRQCYAKSINNIAYLIKFISKASCFISILFGLIMWAETEEAIIPIIIIVVSIIVAIFIYGFGEIIQLLEDIKNK